MQEIKRSGLETSVPLYSDVARSAEDRAAIASPMSGEAAARKLTSDIDEVLVQAVGYGCARSSKALLPVMLIGPEAVPSIVKWG